ncbi:hypothetical protein ABFS83_13G083800 [Erythranthe nasuta]
MGALTTALIAIVAVALGWCTMEIACKPCLEKGREAIDRNLNPDYDPDDQTTLHAPLNTPIENHGGDATPTAVKSV